MVYLYSPCVVYCGSVSALSPIPLQICLPEKLLWWNVRQEKGRCGQTVKLFSLSLCFTLQTSFQNPHLAAIASMREEVRENRGVLMHQCAWLHVWLQIQLYACVHSENYMHVNIYIIYWIYTYVHANVKIVCYSIKKIPHIPKITFFFQPQNLEFISDNFLNDTVLSDGLECLNGAF